MFLIRAYMIQQSHINILPFGSNSLSYYLIENIRACYDFFLGLLNCTESVTEVTILSTVLVIGSSHARQGSPLDYGTF